MTFNFLHICKFYLGTLMESDHPIEWTPLTRILLLKLLKKKTISTVVCEKYLVYQYGYRFFVFLCYYGCHHCSPFLPAKQVKKFFKFVE